jgi:hypothetical protein
LNTIALSSKPYETSEYEIEWFYSCAGEALGMGAIDYAGYGTQRMAFDEGRSNELHSQYHSLDHRKEVRKAIDIERTLQKLPMSDRYVLAAAYSTRVWPDDVRLALTRPLVGVALITDTTHDAYARWVHEERIARMADSLASGDAAEAQRVRRVPVGTPTLDQLLTFLGGDGGRRYVADVRRTARTSLDASLQAYDALREEREADAKAARRSHVRGILGRP